MIKKVILLIMIVFFVSGCDAVYNLDISKNSLNNVIEIDNYDKSTWDGEFPSYRTLLYNNYINFAVPIDRNTPVYPETGGKEEPGFTYYKKELINTADNYGLRLSYNFNNNEFMSSQAFSVFGKMKMNNTYEKLTVNSGVMYGYDVFKTYPMLDNLYIKIKSDYEIIKNNADKVEDNEYTWILTKDNYSEKEIIFEIDKKIKIVNEKESLLLNIILIIGAILLFISGIVIYFKVKNSDK